MKKIHDLNNLVNIREAEISTESITVEHRSNNSKRDYLFVNKFQGKHIPTDPDKSLSEFNILAEKVKKNIADDARVLVIGFAETATAIGSAVAYALGDKCVYRTQTTRCIVNGSKKLIEFSEEHSHATQQYLYGDWESIPEFNYILFVEDEISTGKTIMNFVNKLREIHPTVKFGVASICNWQSHENQQVFIDNDIQSFALIYGELIDEHAKLNVGVSNREFNGCNQNGELCQEIALDISDKDFFKAEKSGEIPNSKSRDVIVEKIAETAIKLFGKDVHFDRADSLCVIGTEENMYYPILVASKLKELLGINVFTHSTTRSPIDICDDTMDLHNGIVNKSRIISPYSSYTESKDTYETFIYNLRKYSKVLIIADTAETERFNMSITAALEYYGNSKNNIKMVKLV